MAWFFLALKSIKPWVPSKYMHQYSLKQSVKYGPWTSSRWTVESSPQRGITLSCDRHPYRLRTRKSACHTHLFVAPSVDRLIECFIYAGRSRGWTWNAHGDSYYKQLRANPVCAVGCSKRVPRLLQQLSCCYYDNRPTPTRRCPHIWKYTTNRTVHTLGSRVYTAYTATTIV